MHHCDLLDELLVLSRRDDLDRYRKRLKYYARIQILFIDDFAISRYSEDGIKILYHLIKTRTDLKTSTMSEPRKPKNVKVIPATKAMIAGTPAQSTAARRVAAYARVSTKDVDQRTSYNNQIDYYTQSKSHNHGYTNRIDGLWGVQSPKTMLPDQL